MSTVLPKAEKALAAMPVAMGAQAIERALRGLNASSRFPRSTR
jgi:hypothetical protein